MARQNSHAFLLFGCALGSLLIPVLAVDAPIQAGNITINPASATAALRLRGQTHDNVLSEADGTTDTHGLTITTTDTLHLTTPASVGEFHLQRPQGAWYWSRADEQTPGASVTMMDLNNDHSLTLHNPDAAAAAGVGAIVLRPGTDAEAGVFFNNARLITQGQSSLALAGGSLTLDPTQMATLPAWIQELASAPGLLAVGQGAYAFGEHSVAMGWLSWAGVGSLAFGVQSYALSHAVALGDQARAGYNSVALGAGASALGYGGLAFGEGYNYGSRCVILGAGYVGGNYATSFNAHVFGHYGFGTAWGVCWGESSIALGGYSSGYKSLAADSGSSLGAYSAAVGRGTVTYRRYQAAFGVYNSFPPDVDPTSIAPPDQTALSEEPLFIIGNGTVNETANPPVEHRSNAFTVSYAGDAWTLGGLTVAGGTDAVPVKSVFQRDVSVKGVLRVAPAGDLGMGLFNEGPPP